MIAGMIVGASRATLASLYYSHRGSVFGITLIIAGGLILFALIIGGIGAILRRREVAALSHGNHSSRTDVDREGEEHRAGYEAGGS